MLLSNLNDVGLALRHARRGQQIRQQQLAWRTGKNQSLISRVEHGHQVEFETLMRLCKALNLGIVIRPLEPKEIKARKPRRRG